MFRNIRLNVYFNKFRSFLHYWQDISDRIHFTTLQTLQHNHIYSKKKKVLLDHYVFHYNKLLKHPIYAEDFDRITIKKLVEKRYDKYKIDWKLNLFKYTQIMFYRLFKLNTTMLYLNKYMEKYFAISKIQHNDWVTKMYKIIDDKEQKIMKEDLNLKYTSFPSWQQDVYYTKYQYLYLISSIIGAFIFWKFSFIINFSDFLIMLSVKPYVYFYDYKDVLNLLLSKLNHKDGFLNVLKNYWNFSFFYDYSVDKVAISTQPNKIYLYFNSYKYNINKLSISFSNWNRKLLYLYTKSADLYQNFWMSLIYDDKKGDHFDIISKIPNAQRMFAHKQPLYKKQKSNVKTQNPLENFKFFNFGRSSYNVDIKGKRTLPTRKFNINLKQNRLNMKLYMQNMNLTKSNVDGIRKNMFIESLNKEGFDYNSFLQAEEKDQVLVLEKRKITKAGMTTAPLTQAELITKSAMESVIDQVLNSVDTYTPLFIKRIFKIISWFFATIFNAIASLVYFIYTTISSFIETQYVILFKKTKIKPLKEDVFDAKILKDSLLFEDSFEEPKVWRGRTFMPNLTVQQNNLNQQTDVFKLIKIEDLTAEEKKHIALTYQRFLSAMLHWFTQAIKWKQQSNKWLKTIEEWKNNPAENQQEREKRQQLMDKWMDIAEEHQLKLDRRKQMVRKYYLGTKIHEIFQEVEGSFWIEKMNGMKIWKNIETLDWNQQFNKNKERWPSFRKFTFEQKTLILLRHKLNLYFSKRKLLKDQQMQAKEALPWYNKIWNNLIKRFQQPKKNKSSLPLNEWYQDLYWLALADESPVKRRKALTLSLLK